MDHRTRRLWRVRIGRSQRAASEGFFGGLAYVLVAVLWLGVIGLIVTVGYWPLVLAVYWPTLQRAAADSELIRIAVVCAGVCVGGVLFLVRQGWRFLRGLCELIVGSGLIWVAFGGVEGALAAVGGVYVLVRAFESLWIGARQT